MATRAAGVDVFLSFLLLPPSLSPVYFLPLEPSGAFSKLVDRREKKTCFSLE
jgi:hypothetical protein